MKEAQAFLREIRTEMPDATHHVYAFKIGFGQSVSEGMSDDGEPSGTSGPPTLAVVRGADVGDIALVTTRYFGGTKLGTGGLVTAYTMAAKAAMQALQTEEKVIRQRFEVSVPYALLERAKRLLAEHDVIIEQETYEADVTFAYLIPEERIDSFARAVSDLTSGRSAPVPAGLDEDTSGCS